VADFGVFAGEHGAHAVIEDLLRHTTECFESGAMTPQQCGQILAQHEAAPHHPAMAEHQ
jgi:hypothetical protein